MITRLEVDGFKSLRNFAVDLEPFTVLVGPNDAGKSNILEALALIARLSHVSPEDALKRGRGRASDQFSRQGNVSVPKIKLTLETLELDVVEDEDGSDPISRSYAERLRYDISMERSVRNGSERIEVEQSVQSIKAHQDPWFDKHPEWKQFLVEPIEPERKHQFLPFFHFSQFNASHLREPSERIDSGRLAADASNLPSVLAGLSDTERGQIRGALAGLVPGIADFDVVAHDEVLQIEFRSREGEKIPARLASDGTLRMLALLTVVLARPTWNAVICIEEPENGIYPGRLSRLIDLLREVSDSTAWRAGQAEAPAPQVILTTHSPIAIDALRRHPASLRWIDPVRRDGVRSTRARRVVDGVPADRTTEASIKEIDLRLRATPDDEER